MFEDLLPAVERGILEAAGAIPVVFKGLERSFEKGASFSAPSRHDHHELVYLRSGRAEFDLEGRKVIVDKGSSLVIRPRVTHSLRAIDGFVEIVAVYFGFAHPNTLPLPPHGQLAQTGFRVPYHRYRTAKPGKIP